MSLKKENQQSYYVNLNAIKSIMYCKDSLTFSRTHLHFDFYDYYVLTNRTNQNLISFPQKVIQIRPVGFQAFERLFDKHVLRTSLVYVVALLTLSMI